MFKVSFQSGENKSSNLNMVHNSTTTRCRKPEEVTQSSLSQWLLHWKLDLERQTLCMLPCPHSTWDRGKRNFQKTWKSAGSMPWWENIRAEPPLPPDSILFIAFKITYNTYRSFSSTETFENFMIYRQLSKIPTCSSFLPINDFSNQ